LLFDLTEVVVSQNDADLEVPPGQIFAQQLAHHFPSALSIASLGREDFCVLLQDDEVVEFIRMFKGRMTPAARKIEPDRRFWQRSFFDHALRKEESLSDVQFHVNHFPAH